jgi:DNA-binding phage protein
MLHLCHTLSTLAPTAEKTVHTVIEDFLLGEEGREGYDQTVRALLARNALLAVLETSRAAEGISKTELAKRAGLDASSVRRLLTSKTANPTTDNAFRLMAAMGIRLDATLPSGKRVPLIQKRVPTVAKRPTKAKKSLAAA